MKIFFVCLNAWFIAQLIKVIINTVTYYYNKKKGISCGRVTIGTLFKLGGMPSSHTATVIALCGCVGLHSGFDTDLFAACGIFAFIVNIIDKSFNYTTLSILNYISNILTGCIYCELRRYLF